ncbi:MAG: hypothetical protein K8S55_06345 [Phycisphaerae bacterium]|nr:hypothetical protein [Phycisphaerae bacterium]
MRIALALVVTIVAILLSGCGDGSVTISKTADGAVDPTRSTVTADGLTLTLDLPKTTLVNGEKFPVKIIAANKTQRRLHFKSKTAAVYTLRLLRYDGLNWSCVRSWPAGAVVVTTTWGLASGKSKTFAPVLTVTPDWPTYEPLRLEAKINGCDTAAFVHVDVVRPK